jgi:hypothetical protein
MAWFCATRKSGSTYSSVLSIGNHDEVAAHDVASPLSPERELLRDLRVLVDHRLDLLRARDLLVTPELVEDPLAVVRRIVPHDVERGHVLTSARHERHHRQELGLVRPGSGSIA